MRNKFVYFCSIKICVLGSDELLESILCLLLVVEAFSLQKVVKMLEEMVDTWWEVRWTWQMRQKFIAQFIQLQGVGCAMCSRVWSWRRIGPILLTNTSCSCCSYRCISLLSIFLRCNGFSGMQKAIEDQTGSRPSKHDLFFGIRLGLRCALELLLVPTTELVINSCHIKPTFHGVEWFIVVA